MRHSGRHFFARMLTLGSLTYLYGCGSGDVGPQVANTPHPRVADITIEVKGAPGPLDSISAKAYYAVENRDCAPPQPISGAQLAPQRDLPVEIRRTGEYRYETTMLIDPFVDQDYYGRGACHWQVASLMVTGSHGKQLFVAPLPGNDLDQSRPFASYFSKQQYLDPDTSMKVYGLHDLDRFARPSDAFAIEIAAKEAPR